MKPLSKAFILLNLLVAYPYAKRNIIDIIKRNEMKIRFLLDSGAFTAWKAKKEIKLDDYCRFIESLPIKPWKYFALDMVGDPKGTLLNYETMLKRGFKPVPIFTRGEDVSLLEEYYKTSEVVGIGGLVGTQENKGFIKGVMRKIGDRKVHWLGFTNLSFLKAFKPYMADSSSWSMGMRYGTGSLYLGRGLPIIQVSKKTIKLQLKNPQIVQAIERYGFNPTDLLKLENWHGEKSIINTVSAWSMRQLSDDVALNIGTKLFFSVVTPQQVDLFLEVK